MGVDISDVAIEIAREQARGTDLDADFVAADVYALPDHLLSESFDLVYSSWGVVCWLPDLARWATIVARCLKPGGTFMLAEHHPLWESLVLIQNRVDVTLDYFGRDTPAAKTTHWSKAVSGAPVQDDAVNFTWPVGDVVTALAEAELRIRRLEERALPEMYLSALTEPSSSAREIANCLPAVYLVLADKI